MGTVPGTGGGPKQLTGRECCSKCCHGYFHSRLTHETATLDRFLDKVLEDGKDSGRHEVSLNVDIFRMPLWEALGELLHFQPLLRLLGIPDRRRELCSVHGVVTPVPRLALFVPHQANQRDGDKELAGCQDLGKGRKETGEETGRTICKTRRQQTPQQKGSFSFLKCVLLPLQV